MKRVTAASIQAQKAAGEKITMLTAYDYPTAQIVDNCGIDIILVGDSCATAVMGRPNTLSITLDQMIHHTRMVADAAKRALVVADMPFMSYHVSAEEAVRNAGRLITEGGAQAVKLEGPISRIGGAVRKILDAGIPVMGHIGLTPQFVHRLGGYKVQGKDVESRNVLIEEAQGLEHAGCFALVIECVPPKTASAITDAVSVPTIGIGAGRDCDGQVLVFHDILGWGKTRFSHCFGDVKTLMEQAVTAYASAVHNGAYPSEEHVYECESSASPAKSGPGRSIVGVTAKR